MKFPATWATSWICPHGRTIEELGLPDEALSAFSGDFAVSLIDLPSETPPRSAGDARIVLPSKPSTRRENLPKILKNKLLALDQNANPLQAGISLVARTTAHHRPRGQAELLKSGKAPNPVGGEERKLLADGYMNVILDFKSCRSSALRQSRIGRARRALLGLGVGQLFSIDQER